MVQSTSSDGVWEMARRYATEWLYAKVIGEFQKSTSYEQAAIKEFVRDNPEYREYLA
jgi:hypothetical protein